MRKSPFVGFFLGFTVGYPLILWLVIFLLGGVVNNHLAIYGIVSAIMLMGCWALKSNFSRSYIVFEDWSVEWTREGHSPYKVQKICTWNMENSFIIMHIYTTKR